MCRYITMVQQRSLGVVGRLTLALLHMCCYVCFEINFKIAQHLAWGKVDCLKRPLSGALSC